MPSLKLLSDYGIIFFMFLVGLELDPGLLRKRGPAVTIIATASIASPLLLGGATGWLAHGAVAPSGVARATFAVFFAVALSITAFPVLARILIERDLARTGLGVLTLACAAINDLVAWCLLAAVLALAQSGDGSSVAATTAVALAYVAVMLLVAPRIGERLETIRRNHGGLSQDLLAIVLLLLFASILAAHWTGIHVIFGAFLLGAALPKAGALTRELAEKIEDLTTVFLLPIYFAYTGLRTDVRLLDSATDWLLCGLVILVATTGKFAGSSLAARAIGISWREAAALGALMNTRGLMELIILNVGLDLGIVSPTLFAIMVIMAIATTLAATPALDVFYPAALYRAQELDDGPSRSPGGVLISVAFSASGPQLLDIAVGLAADEAPCIYALHVPRAVERGILGADVPNPEESVRKTLGPLLDRAQQRGLAPHPLTITSNNPAGVICEVAQLKDIELIVMGWHRPVLRRSVLSGTLEQVMRDSTAEVAVFVDRGPLLEVRRVLVPYAGTQHDRAALRRALALARRTAAQITILHIVRVGRDEPRLEDEARRVIDVETAHRPNSIDTRFVFVESSDPLEAVLLRAAEFDLIIVGIGAEWDLTPGALGVRQERIAEESPVPLLIVRGGLPATPH